MPQPLAERVNNAIVAIDWKSPASPAGVKQAVTDLGSHWIAFWNSAERRMLPPIALHAKLTRYAEWYARAWALMPAKLRDELTHPRDLDPSVWSALEDQLTFTGEGLTDPQVQAQLAAIGDGLAAAGRAYTRGLLVVGGVVLAIGLLVVVVKFK